MAVVELPHRHRRDSRVLSDPFRSEACSGWWTKTRSSGLGVL